MATRYRVRQNGKIEFENIDAYSLNMRDYLKPKGYLENTQYFSKGDNFMKNKVDKHLRNFDDMAGDLGKTNDEIKINRSGVSETSSVKSKQKNGSLIGGLLSNSININDGEDKNKLEMAKIFAMNNGLTHKKPLLKLQNPPVRQGTDTSVFDTFPWSGGEKGPVKFFEPGAKMMVRWQIESPTKDGQWVIKLAEQNDQNEGSYRILNPHGIAHDLSTGYFSWGNLDGNSEGIEVVIPSTITWTEWTLQLTYKTKEFGEMYQCSDISTAYHSFLDKQNKIKF